MASSSQPAVAPQATEASPATNTQDTTPPSSPPLPARSIARPAGGNATSNTANTTAADANVSPAPTQTPTIAPGAPTPGPTATPAAAPPDESLSLNDKLNAGDRYWKFKFGLMAVLVIMGLIGIGCFGWLITSNPDKRSAGYRYGSFWNLWPCMLTWSVSIAWCAICAIIFIVRKRTVHPGVRVSMELLLWIAFIITALCALLALRGLNDFGMYGGPDQWNYDYSSIAGGHYVLASNNTWVWEPNTDGISTPRDCSRGLNTYGDLEFKDCADQDAFINKLWAAKPHRMTVTLTGMVCQFFSLALHFALFVWACVDTHHYRRTKVNKDAEKIAAGIVQTMISNGAIIPPPAQARMNPAPVQGMYYSQVPPQVYSPQPMHMQSAPGQHPQYMGQQQYMIPAQYPMRQQGAVGPAPGVAGPSNEKSGGLRYA